MDADHVPVLRDDALRLLEPERGGLFVDATVGAGGHASALLERSDAARLVGIDRDPQALAAAAERLAPYGERARLVRGAFGHLAELLADQPPAAGILADLGVSSMQLDTAGRGFSFRFDAPLDMRMDPSGDLTAADIVNRYEEADLVKIFREYGEERQARRIARAVGEAREAEPIETTSQLASIVARAKGGGGHRGGRGGRGGHGRDRARIHPATQVFQALRIEVNRELAELEAFLDQAVRLLEDDGRLVVISYHSLEDRRVKTTLRDLARGEIDQVTGRPRAETRLLEVLTKKPIRPSAAEMATNPRARSARLRAARRLSPAAEDWGA